MKNIKITKSSGNIFKDIGVSYPKLRLFISNIKPIISKILNFLASCIRIAVLTAVTIFLLICLTFLISMVYLTLVLTEAFGALLFVIVAMSSALLVVWAFLREKPKESIKEIGSEGIVDSK